MAVAIEQHHSFKPFSRSQRCKLQSFTHLDNNPFNPNKSDLAHSQSQPFNIHKSYSTPCLSLSANPDDEFDTDPRVEIVADYGGPRVLALVAEVAIAIASGVEPVPVSSGLGGAYYIRGRNGDNIAVAKPIDEEPLAFNNPKGLVGRVLGQPGIKKAVRVGETGVRELAAYLLDHGGFSNVPPTALVKVSHVAFNVNNSSSISDGPPYKIASLQRFVDHDFDAGELGPSGFSISSVHRIGILDIRLLNLDRHAGNILVKKKGQENYAVGEVELVPIDHGLCLPEWLDDPYFEWLHWPQASVPFSELKLDYISKLDPFKDAESLRTKLPTLKESSIRVFVICTIFLKRAAAAGLCLADIGQMITREFCSGEESLSTLENVCLKAKASCMNKSYDDDEVDGDDDDDADESEDDLGMFQFDDKECDYSLNIINLDVPRLLETPSKTGKPPKIPRFLSLGSGSSCELLPPVHEEDKHDDDNANDDDDHGGTGPKAGNLTKSMSFSMSRLHNESGGISFGAMSEEEWELFVECFEKCLPEVLESFRNLGLKKRLGSSCEF